MKKLLWLDLETTGLDEKECVILEVGAIITDVNYKVLDNFHMAVSQSSDKLERMNEWCKKQHIASDLVDDVIRSKQSLSCIELKLLMFLNEHKLTKDIILYGNTIGFDRRFIKKHMTQLERRLHYRMMDVSSLKCYFIDRLGLVYNKTKNAHRVVDDIQESIEELKYYSQFIKYYQEKI